MYLSEISAKMGIDRSTVAYHLGAMEKDGLLESGYRILDTKKAARFYHPKISITY
jgi:predicted transcriptional regulator